MADHDVEGAVDVLRFILESSEWAEYSALFDLHFLRLSDWGLPIDSPDPDVWHACQNADAILITANRSGGPMSLDETIHGQGNERSLPVITLSDQQKVLRDRAYAHRCVDRLMNYLDRIESLRGVGRLFVP